MGQNIFKKKQIFHARTAKSDAQNEIDPPEKTDFWQYPRTKSGKVIRKTGKRDDNIGTQRAQNAGKAGAALR